MSGQQPRVGTIQRNERGICGPPQFAQTGSQPLMKREGELHPGCACTHHGDARPVREGGEPLVEREPAIVEAVDGLDPYRMLGGPRHGIVFWRRSQIERQKIVGDGRPPSEQHAPRSTIDANHFPSNQCGLRKPAQPVEVDMHLIPRIVPGDIAGQHAGVGARGCAADQREPHPRLRLHRKAPQHPDVGVATAHQHQVPQHGVSQREDSRAAPAAWRLRS